MRIGRKAWRGIGIAAALLVVGAALIGFWVVPTILASKIQGFYAGKVSVGGWWVGGSSAGVKNLALHETAAADSPVWLRVDSVSTDLTLGGLLRGRTTPSKVIASGPEIVFRLDKDGQAITKPPFRGQAGGGKAEPLPEIVARNAKITFDREGRPAPMVVKGINARAKPGPNGIALSAGTEDPAWGPWTVYGTSASDFAKGAITIRGSGLASPTEKLKNVVFLPPDVPKNVRTDGPVDCDVVLHWGGSVPIEVGSRVAINSATVELPDLGLTTQDTRGLVLIQGSKTQLQGLSGQALGGSIGASGVLDFGKDPARLAIDLDLRKIDVKSTPKAWQLDEAGVSGRLTGKAHLLIGLGKGGADLTGSTGEADIEGASLGGIPVKSLKLGMTAQGGDLQYAQAPPANGASEAPKAREHPIANRGGTSEVQGPTPGVLTPPLIAISQVAQQIKANQDPAQKPDGQKKGLVLPKSVSTRIELEDVDLKQLLIKGESIGIHLPFPVAGRLSLKAEATIPLGNLRGLKDYVIRGDLDLKGASIDGVDLGRLAAKVDLANGLLKITDFRGRFADRPDGDNKNPPPVADLPPSQGDLPIGGFRGAIDAQLAPAGPLSARFEANRVPVGELAAPFFPRPTPVSGLLSLSARAEATVASLSDPKAWSVEVDLNGDRIVFRGTSLDSVSARASLKDGRVDLPDLRAVLEGKPLRGRFGSGLSAPFDFRAGLDVEGWKIADLLAFVPSVPKPAPADGVVSVKAEASGTLSPLAFRSNGTGKVAALRAGSVAIGDVPISWETKGDDVLVSITDAHPFGGLLNASASVPTKGDRPIRGSATASGVDVAKLGESIPGIALRMGGKADAKLDFSAPPGAGALQANLNLNAPELTVQGIPAEGVEAKVEVVKGLIHYEILANSLGGKVKFQGDFPIGAAPPKPVADAHLQVAAIDLPALWTALNLGEVARDLRGQAALDANLRTPARPIALRSHGLVEARDLRWGMGPSQGGFRAVFLSTPAGWRADPIRGELLGGAIEGAIWGESPWPGLPPIGFDLGLERASIAGLASAFPKLAYRVEGDLSVRLGGGFRDALRAEGEARIGRARIFGIPVEELHAPIELTFAPGSGSGTLIVRDLTGRAASGQIRGGATARIGPDRSYSAEISGSGVGLDAAIKPFGDMGRNVGGKVSGKVAISGPDPSEMRRLKGRVDLDLDDASIGEVPIFREIDKFLGSARGGLFEDGDLHGSIAERRLIVEEFTLSGRLAQIHITGTIGFDGRLDLAVLINTNQIITQSGEALAGSIPGMRNGRGDAARLFSGYLADRLMKLRVGGTLTNPQVTSDPGVVVTNTAALFFGTVLKLPLGLLR